MGIRFIFAFLFASFICIFTFPDTFTLKSGITFDGQIVDESADGIYTIQVGKKIFKYTKDEIANIQKNDKTGEINLDEAKKEWEEKDKLLTEKTGLNKDQRAQVEALISRIQWGEEVDRVTAKNGLLELQKTMDIFPYLEYYLPSYSPTITPHILEILYKINKDKTIKILRDKILDSAPTVRGKAIELLAIAKDTESYNLIIRGLVDPDIDVCIITNYAIAHVGLKSVTPVLIENLSHPEPRIANSSKEALNNLWKIELNNKKIDNIEEWKSFWEQHKNEVSGPIIYKKDIEPLIDKNFQYFIG
ncbi:MAG: HEAT repeat domain-containing protein [Candidatus Hydrogenedens sp.]